MFKELKLKDIFTAIIHSIDLINFVLKDHHRRVTVIAYNLGKSYGLSEKELMNLVIAASLHDIGAISIQERIELVKIDVDNTRNHEYLGKMMLEPYKPLKAVTDIIEFHHHKWQNGSNAFVLGHLVPIECYLLHLADRIDILIDTDQHILNQQAKVLEKIEEMEGSVFKQDCVDAFRKLYNNESFWLDIDNVSMMTILDKVMLEELRVEATLENTEELSEVMSRIVDFRCEFTATHSLCVGHVANYLGTMYGLNEKTCKKIKIAGFLHDIGKLGVPVELVEKKEALTDNEYNKMKSHSYFTNVILGKIPGFEDICSWASMHHEKRDGSGYPYHIEKRAFSVEMDILAVADVYAALSEDRPYRKGMSKSEIIQVFNENYRGKLNEEIIDLLITHFDDVDTIRLTETKKGSKEYKEIRKELDMNKQQFMRN